MWGELILERQILLISVVGEFGPVYQSAGDGLADWKHINDTRFGVLEQQLSIYAKADASYSIWLYKGPVFLLVSLKIRSRYRLPGHDVCQ